MKKIIAFAGSNSSTSINKQLATYASELMDDVETEILDLNDYDLPMFGVDLEEKIGEHETAQRFLDKIKGSDGIILSLAEHNGAYAAVFKNLLDWMSRIEGKVWQEKPMLLMASSPGGRGGATVLQIASAKFPRMGADIVSTFSLPSFNDNFRDGKIINENLNDELQTEVKKLKKNL